MISDSDQDISGLPTDWVDVLMTGLQETGDHVWKSGLSQRIDDLSSDNPYAQEIYAYEKNFYTNQCLAVAIAIPKNCHFGRGCKRNN